MRQPLPAKERELPAVGPDVNHVGDATSPQQGEDRLMLDRRPDSVTQSVTIQRRNRQARGLPKLPDHVSHRTTTARSYMRPQASVTRRIGVHTAAAGTAIGPFRRPPHQTHLAPKDAGETGRSPRAKAS